MVSSSPRSVAATISSWVARRRRVLEDQVVDGGGGRAPSSAGPRRAGGSGWSGRRSRSSSPRAWPCRCRRRTPTPTTRPRPGTARVSRPGRARVAAQRQRQLGQPVADPVAAAGLGEDVAALVGVAGLHRPVEVDHQVADGRRRQQRLVPAGRQVDPPLPTSPASAARRRRGRPPRRRGSRGCPRPAQTEREKSGLLPLSSTRPVGWSVRSRRPVEVPRYVVAHGVLGEAEEQLVAVAGLAEGLPERRREVGEDLDRGLGRVGVPVAAAGRRLARPAGRRPRRVRRPARPARWRRPARRRPASRCGRRCRRPCRRRRRRTRRRRRAASASRRWWSGCWPPSAGWPPTLSVTKVTCPSAVEAASARSTSSCGVQRAHRPASWTVLRMLTFSNSAVGQPWLTGATCPGWALPQLKAPPST